MAIDDWLLMTYTEEEIKKLWVSLPPTHPEQDGIERRYYYKVPGQSIHLTYPELQEIFDFQTQFDFQLDPGSGGPLPKKVSSIPPNPLKQATKEDLPIILFLRYVPLEEVPRYINMKPLEPYVSWRLAIGK